MSLIGSILSLNLARFRARKSYFIPLLIITFLTMGAAGFFTAKFELQPNLAIVGDFNIGMHAANHFKLHYLDSPPLKSELVSNKYDAVLHVNAAGSLVVETLKGEELKESILHLLTDPDGGGQGPSPRGIGVNVLGYSLIFILLQGLLYLTLFADDKNSGCFTRCLTTPLSLGQYISGQFIFCFVMIYSSTLLSLGCLKLLGVHLGFTFRQYSGLLLLPAALAASFGFLMLAFIEKHDDALSFSAATIVLTSLIAGSFHEVEQQGALQQLIKLLPQRHFLAVVEKLETQHVVSWPSISYIISLCFLFLLLGGVISHSRSKLGKY